ncbi:MAG TPA: phytanoyl-CoA dioxygenase family protein [Acidimicrobiales bacterium]|nr:phytanoyl-CoA dioxygenase family protein [Acidimicrobiales bacterium]
MKIDRDAARSTYATRGYWVSPVLFDADEVERFIVATQRVVDGVYGLDRQPTLSLPASPRDDDLRKIDNAWWADPDLAALATDTRLGELAALLLDAACVRLWQDQLLFKPPGGPTTTTIGWHQDWASWDTVASHDAFVTAWVAFDDVDDENGAMQMIPGSHARGLVKGASNFFATDRDAQLPLIDSDGSAAPESVVLRAGQVSFHHPLTFHGSGPNTSNRLRRSLAIHFVDGAVTAVSRPGIWQHYNLALFQERGGQLDDQYGFNDLCPTVWPQASR